MSTVHPGSARAGLAAVALAGLLAACGSSTPSATATPTPTPTPSPLPTPSPTPAPPAPLVVTFRDVGPPGTPWTAVQLSLVGEDGTVAGTVIDPGGAHGDSYAVGSDHVYFIDGTTVKSVGRDGTVNDAGQVPTVRSTVTADDLATNTAIAVSPDESTLVFGIPLAIQGDNGATSDHSQLWTEPVGGTAASATMVYDDKSSDGSVIVPVSWTDTAILVSNRPTSGLGGAGPFLDYSRINPATFDPTSHVLTTVRGNCSLANPRAIDPSARVSVCRAPNSSVLTVELSSGTRMVTMQPATATGFGSIAVSDEGRYLAYGAYIGEFGNGGHYVATVIDLSSGATVAVEQGYTPMQWLNDDRLVVSPSFVQGAAYLLSPTFTAPGKIAPDQPVDALA